MKILGTAYIAKIEKLKENKLGNLVVEKDSTFFTIVADFFPNSYDYYKSLYKNNSHNDEANVDRYWEFIDIFSKKPYYEYHKNELYSKKQEYYMVTGVDYLDKFEKPIDGEYDEDKLLLLCDELNSSVKEIKIEQSKQKSNQDNLDDPILQLLLLENETLYSNNIKESKNEEFNKEILKIGKTYLNSLIENESITNQFEHDINIEFTKLQALNSLTILEQRIEKARHCGNRLIMQKQLDIFKSKM